jgi:leucyl aminopeptidase
MTISTSLSDPSKTKLDALLVVSSTFERTSAPWTRLGTKLAKLCQEVDSRREFLGKQGQILISPTFKHIAAPLIAFVGLGDTTDALAQKNTLGKAIRQLQQRKVRSLGVCFTSKPPPAEILVHAAEEATYRFSSFTAKPQESPQPLSALTLFSKTIPSASLNRARAVAEALSYTRDLANQPPNLFNPQTLAAEAQKLARQRKLRCEVWDERRLKREGFGGILAVGQGSANPPRFVRLDYRGGRPNQAPYVIIGKAITFDTGGISIKPSDRMDEMKFDKCGGIAVLGIMNAISALRLPINVTGLISSAENMPSSKAYRPGDLIKTLSGKYIEVLNTDAEGRIVLADALTYSHRLKPRAVVDLATLTGACIICFGHDCAAVLGNQNALIEDLRAASERTGEKIWPMPIWPEYQDKVKSDIGFVKNTAGREGGTITAACFLNAFMDSNIPWAHLDIAGVAWTNKEEAHRAKGATAFGVRLVTDWLQVEAS